MLLDALNSQNRCGIYYVGNFGATNFFPRMYETLQNAQYYL